MTNSSRRFRSSASTGLAAVATLALLTQLCMAGEPDDKSAAMQRARREVRMLDDIYKTGIVAITEHYVTDDTMIPAGTAFKKIFEAAEKKGWHKVRLVDATGDPLEKENAPEDKFERRAIADLVAGETWVEATEDRNGVRHLRVATPIPVVFQKCVTCHDNYAAVPKGRAIGALIYALPLDGPLVTTSGK